ncbi:hypothetical protein [Aureimonas sp. AU22]|uniref:hypothetical protein n=1 Tax=Aureimonas sp. AU22 TaxID=1638162 RepID=UPI000A7EE33D|nr:hypothetical protein [Aureimonas sp. AU22]
MSNTPGISPITPDIEDVRHSDEDGFFGDEAENGSGDEGAGEDKAPRDDEERAPER